MFRYCEITPGDVCMLTSNACTVGRLYVDRDSDDMFSVELSQQLAIVIATYADVRGGGGFKRLLLLINGTVGWLDDDDVDVVCTRRVP